MSGPGKLLLVFTVLLYVDHCLALLELHESVEWKFHRNLYDYTTYGAVTVERIDIPYHPVLVNLSSSVESSNSNCPVHHVKIYANQLGFPVVSRDQEVFPSKVFVSTSPVLNVSVASTNQTVLWQMERLLPGQLILMAVMPRPDSRIKQQGLEEECDYYMNTRASILYYQEKDIPQLGSGRSHIVKLTMGSPTVRSFRVPADTRSYTVDVQGCKVKNCSVTVSVWETLAIDMEDGDDNNICHWLNGSCRLEVTSPAVNRLSFLSLSSNVNIDLNIDITISDCDMNHTGSHVQPAAFTCIFAGDLGRETPRQEDDSSNFNDHFVTWNKSLSPYAVVSLKTWDTAIVVTRFALRTSDTGASLKVYLHIPVEKSPNLARTILCLSAHRLLHPRQCHTGALLNVTTQKDNNKDYVIVPYPQSGLWFVSLESQCFHVDTNKSHEVPVACKSGPVANLTVHLDPCIDGGCGEYGVCKLYMETDLLYSACSCYAGWRGYGCNDGSQAVSSTNEKLAVYLLTLSNLGFVPGICLAVYRRFYVEALVYSYNMFFSTFYHACDTSGIYQLCIMPYNSLSFADFFASLMSFWVTLMAMARIHQGLRSFLHMLSALFISLGEVYNRHGLVEQLIPIAGGVLIVLASWAVESLRRKTVFPSKRRLLRFILPGVALSCLGLTINLALQTDSNYKYLHSTWHLLESFCILLLLPPRRDKLGTSGTLSIQSGDITRQSVVDSQEFEASIYYADGTATVTPLEQPSPPETPTSSRERGLKLLNRSTSRQSQSLVL